MPNSFDAAYVSGGSSSGWASVVARGLVAFALGTDTATPADNALQALPADGGAAIEVEVYEMPQAALGSILALIPPPLSLGLVQLADVHVHGVRVRVGPTLRRRRVQHEERVVS